MPANEAHLAGGGVAATAAVTLARLGIPVAFIGRVGDDEPGRMVVDGIAREGVDTSGLRVVEGRTPVARRARRGRQRRADATCRIPEASRRSSSTGEDIARCSAADWIHVDQTGHPTIADRRRGGSAGRSRSRRQRRSRSSSSRRSNTTPRPNGRSSLAIPAGRCRKRSKRPSQRARTWSSSRAASMAAPPRNAPPPAVGPRCSPPPAEPSQVVSTLGAGDVFHGAFLAAMVEGRSLPDALRWANAAAALSCRRWTGVEPSRIAQRSKRPWPNCARPHRDDRRGEWPSRPCPARRRFRDACARPA